MTWFGSHLKFFMLFIVIYIGPKSNRFLVTPYDENMFKIELAKPPRRLTDVSDNPQPLETKAELTVMHRYSKAQGGKMYEVHRWPDSIANDSNRFNHPYMMSESELYEFSGLSPLNFWSYCQILDGYGCKNRPTISLPSQVLLFRVKLWQNSSNACLAHQFGIDKKCVSVVFWCCTVYIYVHENESLRFWSR